MEDFVDYYDVEKLGSFTGAHSFAKVANHPKRWQKTQETYTLHSPVRKRFKRRKTIVPGMKFQMQADLIDVSAMKKFNVGFKYIVVLIDFFLKSFMRSVLKTKRATV